jgi:hypothetical protein
VTILLLIDEEFIPARAAAVATARRARLRAGEKVHLGWRLDLRGGCGQHGGKAERELREHSGVLRADHGGLPERIAPGSRTPK